MSSSFQKPQAQQSCTYEESVSLAWRELVVKISCELSLIPTTQQVYCWRYMQSLEKAAKQERVLHKVPWALKKCSFSMLTIPSVKLSVLWWLYFEAGQPSESAFWPEILHGSLKSITQKKKPGGQGLLLTLYETHLFGLQVYLLLHGIHLLLNIKVLFGACLMISIWKLSFGGSQQKTCVRSCINWSVTNNFFSHRW